MCGGFQHVVLEFVRNVIGLHDAEHAETDAAAATLAVTPLACSLVGQRHPVHLVAGSRTAAIYRSGVAVEPFFCSYGLNHALEPSVEAAGLRVSGRDRDFTARVVELHEHSFFIATLYVFQARNERPNPHPLTAAFLDAARAARLVRGASGAQLARPLTS